MEITFETLPIAVAQINEKLDKLLLQRGNSNSSTEDELLTVSQTADFLSLAIPTIYSLISKGELPVMKRGKRCYFSKADLFNYLKAGRKKTNLEIEAEAANHVSKKRSGR